MKWTAAALLVAAATPAWGQFELYLVNGNIEQPVGRAFDFGPVEPGGSLTVPFRIRNISNSPATLDLLTVSGAGFSFFPAAAVPVTLASQNSLDFGVLFQSAGTGNYSAALDTVGISAILTAEVPVELTAQLQTGASVRALSAAPVDFGEVSRGALSAVHVLLVNQTDVVLFAPTPLVSGVGFSLSGPSPGGIQVRPTASVGLDLQFSPTTDGTAGGWLTLDGRTYALKGVGIDPPLPHPRISLTLPQASSAQQGSIAVTLDAASESAGSGTVTLSFAPAEAGAADAGIAFAVGGQSAGFTVAPGDTQGHFDSQLTAPFQTGTTAGTLTIAVQLGTNSDSKTITILPAVVGVTAAQAVRSAGAVEVDLTGFDNTRSAGALAFTFFDAAGNAIAVNADGSAAFASYFQGATAGTFELKAVFPVLGDATQIKAFQAVVTNSAGSATTARTSF